MSPSLAMPLFGLSDEAFYRGSTARSKATSASGAAAALVDRHRKIDTLRRLWARPLTIQEASAISGYPLASVCSLKKCLANELVEAGDVEKLWANGRITRRMRWQIGTRGSR